MDLVVIIGYPEDAVVGTQNTKRYQNPRKESILSFITTQNHTPKVSTYVRTSTSTTTKHDT